MLAAHSRPPPFRYGSEGLDEVTQVNGQRLGGSVPVRRGEDGYFIGMEVMIGDCRLLILPKLSFVVRHPTN